VRDTIRLLITFIPGLLARAVKLALGELIFMITKEKYAIHVLFFRDHEKRGTLRPASRSPRPALPGMPGISYFVRREQASDYRFVDHDQLELNGVAP
jgi:hypothetical protein